MSASKRADGGTPSLSATRPIIFMPIIVALPRVCDPSTQRGLPSVAKGGDTGSAWVKHGTRVVHTRQTKGDDDVGLDCVAGADHGRGDGPGDLRESAVLAKTQDVVRMAPSRMLSDEVQRRLLVYEDTLRKV